ncbi:hypothetical protein V0288_09295 [Pannus brasiliensis CCIBt3594]|uniref:Uncharacterized protein n=1 Tax=Pannus brasiliensis CCIBt3594 TaxID=1427578 RepID=A0AAW9QUP1_9CHRO
MSEVSREEFEKLATGFRKLRDKVEQMNNDTSSVDIEYLDKQINGIDREWMSRLAAIQRSLNIDEEHDGKNPEFNAREFDRRLRAVEEKLGLTDEPRTDQ